jgi:hypothetical protein
MGSDATFKNEWLRSPIIILASEGFEDICVIIVIPAIKVWTSKNRFFVKDSYAIVSHTMSILLAIIIHMCTSRRYYTVVCKKVIMCTYHNHEGIVQIDDRQDVASRSISGLSVGLPNNTIVKGSVFYMQAEKTFNPAIDE